MPLTVTVTAADMEATADFLERNAPFIDRIRFNEFAVPVDTPIHRALAGNAGEADLLTLTWLDTRRGCALFDRRGVDRAYRRAKARALRAVHLVNRRPLSGSARQFDGLM